MNQTSDRAGIPEQFKRLPCGALPQTPPTFKHWGSAPGRILR